MKLQIKYLLLLLLTLSTGHLYAKLQGQAKIDSLLKELPRQKEDTNKAKLLNDLSYGYSGINPDEGIKYAMQDLELAAKLNWKKGIGLAYNVLGTNYQSKSDLIKALECFLKALKLAEETGNKTAIAGATGNIGIIYTRQGNYPKALESQFYALKMYEEIGDKRGLGNTTGNIGTIYSNLNDYPKALEYYFKALKLNEESGHKKGIATVTVNIGIVYKDQKDYPKALEYFFKALKLDEEEGYKQYAAGVANNIGNVYTDQKNFTMAAEYFQKSLKIADEIADKYLIAANLANVGHLYIAIIKDTPTTVSKVTVAADLTQYKIEPTASIPKGKAALLTAAIDHFQRSLATMKEIKDLYFVQICYNGLCEAYKLKGDYKKAMEFADSTRIVKDSVFSQENREKIAKMEDARKEYGDSLKAADAKIAADVKAQHRRNYELVGGGVIVLLIGFAFFITRNRNLLSKEKKQSENLLLNILPEEVATQLKQTGAAAARNFDNVTVLFTDFVNFTEASGRMKPEALIEELDTCFKKFDAITGKYSIEKIKTIGDAYLAVCGLPHPNREHALNIVKAAQEINAFMQDREAKVGNTTFKIRIGVHTGSVIAGIVGDKKFAYDIWGDTVNTAARMEQSSEAGKINISQTTYDLVKDKIDCEYRGEIDAKGKGAMKMYYVG